jgi:WD40 repeat protein
VKKSAARFCFHLILTGLFLLIAAGCSKEQQKSEQKPATATKSAENEVLGTTTVLSTVLGDEQPRTPDPAKKHALPMGQQQPFSLQVVFDARGRGVAHCAESGATEVVYNGKAGKRYDGIGRISLSSDGRRIAYGALLGDKWRMVIDGSEGEIFDEVGEPVFSPDGQHVAYEAKRGEKWRIVADNYSSTECPSYYDNPVFSADSTKILVIENVADSQKRLVVSDLSFSKKSVKNSIGSMIVPSGDKTRIAAIIEKGPKKRVVEFSFAEPDTVKEGKLYDDIRHLVVDKKGNSVAYVAEQGGARFMVLNGKEERLPDGDLTLPPVIRPDQKGAGVLWFSKGRSYLLQAFQRDGIQEKSYEETSDLVYSGDGSQHAYAARNGKSWFVVVNGKEGPAFDKVVTPVFSPDGRVLVYRARKDGKRFMVVSDSSSKVINQHPPYEMVFPPVFTAGGKAVAYGVKDGRQFIWKVETL